MKKHNIPLKNVIQHNDASGKDCPHFMRAGTKGITWAQFKTKVKNSNGKSSGGSSGSSGIKQLQKDLKELGYKPGKADGIDGKNTQSAVKEFQKAEGLSVDGIAGKDTKAEIKRILNGGLTMSEKDDLQKQINALKKDKLDKPSDSQNPGKSHEESVKKINEAGYMQNSDPNHFVTRAQLASVIDSALLSDYDFKKDAEQNENLAEIFDWAKENEVSNLSNLNRPVNKKQVITMLKKAVDTVDENTDVKEDETKEK